MKRTILTLACAAFALASVAKANDAKKTKVAGNTAGKAKPKAKSKTSAQANPSNPKASSEPTLVVTYGKMTDSRDGQTYRTVAMGKQTWMAENLNFASDGSLCYESRKQNCDQYGRLYDWATAKKVCPSGWHLPDDEEWTAMEKFLGRPDSAGRLLKTTNGWSTNGNGNDRSGFSAIAAGNSDRTGLFNNLGFAAVYWTSSHKFMGDPWCRRLRFDETSLARESSEKSNGFSVRCLKDGF